MDQASLLATAFKMTVALGAVLLTFGGALLIARKFSGISPSFLKKMGTRKEKPMEILAFQSLGPGKGLYLVRCLDKKILVGSTSHSINQIIEIVDESEEEQDLAFSSSLTEKVNKDSNQNISSRMQADLREISRV
jgi:flagellar biogenesis protein FliO